MKKQAEELKPKPLPKSTLGQAVNYFLNDYDALIGYLKDGHDQDQPDPRAAPRSVETSPSEYLLKTGSSFGLLLRWA